MSAERVHGVDVHGNEPKQLMLSDGSRLTLDPDGDGPGPVRWRRLGWRRRGGSNEVSTAEAATLAGERFRDYVEVRTRAEAQWMREVADWYRHQADRLERELDWRD